MKLAIVEDHSMMLDFLRKICVQVPGIQLVAEAHTGFEACDRLIHSRPDLVILDVGLPGLDGFEVLERIRAAGVRPKVLILSGSNDPYFVYRVERANVQAFIDKRSQTGAELRAAIAAIDSNRSYFSESFVLERTRRRSDPLAFDKLLTEQQLLVMCLVADCHEDEHIGRILGISSRTVEAHRTAIMRKLGIHTRTGLISYGQKRGFRSVSAQV